MIGLGSIGQRHLRNIKRLYGDIAELAAYRVRRLQKTFSDDMKIRDGVELEKEYGIKVFSDLDAVWERYNPDIVFVTNITSKHMECATEAARAGCDIFIEKPLSDNTLCMDELIRLVDSKGIVAYMGYQNRYHPCITDVKKLLAENAIGKLVSVDSDFSERLPTMHTYEDYSSTYMARRDMGGGPVLNLQIHCLDYLQWLFGEPESVYTVAGHNTSLNIDVEDYASSLYVFKQSDSTCVPVYAHTDFLQYPPSHTLKVVGEFGRIEADLNRIETKLYRNGYPNEVYSHPDFKRNDMFLRELEDFMDCIKYRRKPCSCIESGIVGLKMALAAKKSAEEDKKIYIAEV